jgi:hypothetical protein
MVWLFVLLVLSSFFMGLLNAPQWVMFIVFILFVIGVMYITLYPVLYEKNINKILEFLKKSKNAHYHFLLNLYNGNIEEAEKALKGIKSEQLKYFAKIALLNYQNRFIDAKAYLSKLKESESKWYYSAAIALEENDLNTYEENLSFIKDPLNRSFLDIEVKMRSGEKQQALAMLEEHIRKLRGLKLLTAVQYKKELEQR